mgnify:CR=1 FL=1
MKKIEAIIRKTKFEDVKDALLEADIEWFSYYDVRGIGKSRQARIYRGVMYDTSSIERILISIVVRDKNAEKTVQAIIKSAQPVKSATDVSSSSPLRMPYAYVLQREATSHSTMPNKKDNGQLQTTTKKIQYN